ncbi:MAG: hypothetical protein KBT36_07025 [Kurthia sp.]|nr:hypothetical protein [Candidatus Kurthia equi]
MGIKWIRIAVIYLLIGVLFGMYMHITIQLQWKATHAHINLVGWLTTAAFGIFYSLYPKMGNSKLGVIHFWIHNIGLPLLLLGMLIIYIKSLRFLLEPFVWIGGLALIASILIMLYNVFTQVKTVGPLKEKKEE